MSATGVRINWWGVAAVALFSGGYFIQAFCLARGPYADPRIYSYTCYQVGLVLGLLSLACAIVATKRGSRWWVFVALLSAWFSVVSFFGEL